MTRAIKEMGPTGFRYLLQGIQYKYSPLGIRIKNNLRFSQLLPKCHIKNGRFTKVKKYVIKGNVSPKFRDKEILLAIKWALYSALQN